MLTISTRILDPYEYERYLVELHVGAQLSFLDTEKPVQFQVLSPSGKQVGVLNNTISRKVAEHERSGCLAYGLVTKLGVPIDIDIFLIEDDNDLADFRKHAEKLYAAAGRPTPVVVPGKFREGVEGMIGIIVLIAIWNYAC